MSSNTKTSPEIVGVDIGGTKIAAGYLDQDGRPVPLGTAPTTPFDGHANVRALEALLSDPQVAGAPVLAVSVATTFDHDGALRDPRGWFGWQGKVLADVLTTRDRSAFVYADAAAGAVGEYAKGAGKAYGHLLYITVGTGVSHSFLVNGKPLNGAHNAAYFSGYTPQARCDRPACDFPHVESICSGPGIARAFSGPQARDARPVMTAAEDGDPGAVAIVNHAAWHLGALIASLVLMYDPDCVVIGGGLGSGAHVYRSQAIDIAREVISVQHGKLLPIIPAALGSMSPWVGAAEMARHELEMGTPTRAEALPDTAGAR
ncbi:ROK family protein [Arthrobacter sp. W4I7]|uniref:ROK family protein n=1 Tax=Arthrobacter sp. W4I7 TaxID=3042296 RepID=UPI0027D77D3C|nr:ROK family protein [Arthrobacter sp. W4I7]